MTLKCVLEKKTDAMANQILSSTQVWPFQCHSSLLAIIPSQILYMACFTTCYQILATALTSRRGNMMQHARSLAENGEGVSAALSI